MNDKQRTLMKIVDAVINCCSTSIDDSGKMNITKEEVLGKSRKENVCLTRTILVEQIVGAGYSRSTAAELLGRSVAAVRNMIDQVQRNRMSSMAYRIADAQATLECKKILSEY